MGNYRRESVIFQRAANPLQRSCGACAEAVLNKHWRSAGAHKIVFFIGDGIIRGARASMMETDAQDAKAHGDAIRHGSHGSV
jgi:hypothetical protein